VLSVLPYKVKKVGAIITGSEIYNGRIQDRFEPILREKLKKFGAELFRVTVCDDELDMIKGAIEAHISSGAELILLTGGMSVDPDDLTPTAIRESGARVVTQGVPMQPGNMLTVAYRGEVTLIGVPGASMHSPVTSLDVFLPRVMAGVELHENALLSTGEGGFCMGCKQCTYPLCYFGYSISSVD
jgi:molybdenum cofactor synthesis domain-containing protein